MKNIYLDYEYFKHSCVNNTDHPFRGIINSTIASNSTNNTKGTLFFNKSSDEIIQSLEDPNSPVFYYRKAHSQAKTNKFKWQKFTDEKNIINSIKNDCYDNIHQCGVSLFIIDIDKTKAEYIRENYSIWILSLTELHESNKQINLTKTFDSRTKLQDKEDKNKVIYQYLFNQMKLKLPKVNNVIIADPYILQSTKSNKSFYKNIHSLLDAILPITFIGDKIHITIITSMDSEGSFRNDTQGDYKKLQELNQIRTYEINLSIIFTYETMTDNDITYDLHKRIIYTNIFKIKFDNNRTVNIAKNDLYPEFTDEIQVKSMFDNKLDDIDIKYFEGYKYFCTWPKNKIYNISTMTESQDLINPILQLNG